MMEYEVRPIPSDPNLLESARNKPGSWVYEIDFAYPDDQAVPPEAIRGAWESGADGQLTGKFARNERYRAIQHPARELPAYMHAGAKLNSAQWIVEIDPRGEHLFPAIPTEMIKGWWYVNDEGRITDMFRPNSQWQAPEPA